MTQVAPSEGGQSEIMEISMGPQHPSTHGVFRMDVRLDGERVLRLKPVFGYLHRNHEKIAEAASYLAAIPYTDRLDYLCSMTNNWGYALAVEKLAGLVRSGAGRVYPGDRRGADQAAESCRDGGIFAAGYGNQRHSADVCLPWERVLDLFESLSGARMMSNYMRFGGVRVDCSAEWLGQTAKLVAGFDGFLDEFEKLLTGTGWRWRAPRVWVCCLEN